MDTSPDAQDGRLLLEQFVPEAEYHERLLVAFKQTKDLGKTLQQFGQDTKDVPAGVQQKIKSLTDLNALAGGKLDLVRTLVQGQEPKSTTTLVENGYSRLSGASALEYRQRIFASYPVPTLIAAVKDSEIPVPEGAREQVLKALHTVVSASDFDIRKQSLAESVQPKNLGLNDQALTYLRDLQRTLMVVDTAEDIGCLLRSGFTSAKAIASTAPTTFVKAVTYQGASDDAAKAIHSKASTITARNEQTWIDIQQVKQDPALAALTTTPASSFPKTKQPDASVKLVPYESAAAKVLFDMDDIECEDCCSITSPCAYYVDLLRMLQNCWIDAGQGAKGPSLLTRLLARRPDLENLRLSCENANHEVSSLDLVNEAMESFIVYLNDSQRTVSVATANHPDDCHTEKLPPAGHPLEREVYSKFLRAQTSPMNIFPYDYSVEQVRTTLTVSRSSRAQLLENIRSYWRLCDHYGLSIPVDQAERIFRRALAIESLGMVAAEFHAITQESVWPLDVLRGKESYATMTDDQYRKAAGIPAPSDYWGFSDAAAMTKEGTGLSDVYGQLLPRSGISFAELVEILKME